MKKTLIRVTLEIEVFDKAAFRAAAIEKAKKDGLEVGDEAGFDPKDLGRCAMMLIDPGVSPPGCQIEESCAENLGSVGTSFGGDEEDEDEDEDEEEEDTEILATVGLKPSHGQ